VPWPAFFLLIGTQHLEKKEIGKREKEKEKGEKREEEKREILYSMYLIKSYSLQEFR
jgi:hypothetical protein